MNKDTEKNRTQSALILAGMLLLIVKTEYYWKQIVGLIPLVIKIAVALLAISVAVMICVSSIRLYKERKALFVRMFLPAAIYLFGIFASFFDPFHLNAESLQSRVVLRGHFNATMNSATITFRHNGRTEFEGNGFLGYAYFYAGSWTLHGDTLTTVFNADAPIPWGRELIVDKVRGLLLPLDSVGLSQQFPGFLLDEENINVESQLHEGKVI